MIRTYLPVLLLALALSGCAAQPGSLSSPPPAEESIQASSVSVPAPELPAVPAGPSPAEKPDPRQSAVDTLLSTMSREEKVGQLFFVRCPAEGGAELAGQYHLGGYLLFGRDFKGKTAQEVTQAIAAYQAASPIPLVIGVDEEGGDVVRVSSNPNLRAQPFPSPQQLYQEGGLEAVRTDSGEKNTLLRSLGIHVNFAPVADVSTNPGDFIYHRTIGLGAEETAAYISAVVEQMEADGVGSVLKHFPGYGGNLDTHSAIAVDQRSYSAFESGDFLPFSAGIAAGADCVLVSHNIVTCMDPNLPASLSPEVHRILREELDFSGIILTDDLAMDAIDTYTQDGSAAVLALLAGNDMVVTTDFTAQIPQVLKALEEGVLTMEQIDQAVERVLLWKYDLGLIA